jgi:3-isopropylmalate/(R)-2-methylmalate dehydratase small subunit
VTEAPQAHRVTVDLVRCEVTAGADRNYAFTLEGEAREMLLEGLDAIDLTLKHRERINQFIEQDRQRRPWIYS